MPAIVVALLVLIGAGAAAGGGGNVQKFINARKARVAAQQPAPQNVTQVPTPALLPGLVAFGVSTLRKRRSLSDQAANEDANNS